MAPSDERNRRLIATGYFILLAVLLVSYYASYQGNVSTAERTRAVSHTREVLATLSSISAFTMDAESAQRGYILTGQASLVDRFKEAGVSQLAALDHAVTLTRDNPRQQARLNDLRGLLKSRQDKLREALDVYKSNGEEAARTLVTRNAQAPLDDDIRRSIGDAASEENDLLAKRQASANVSIRRALPSFVIGSIIGIVCLTGLYVYITAVIKMQVAARKVEQAHREALEVQIREKEAAEGETKRLLTELERSNRELQDFAFVASHDLQEPLRKIQAFGDRIKTKGAGRLDADSLDYLDRMQSAASRMQGLINDILDLSRVATKAQPFVTVDLNDSFNDALDDLVRRIEETDATVEIGKLTTIQGDATQLRQLAFNLVGNALKFHKPDVKPIIRVACERVQSGSGSKTRLTVSDNGIGFEQRHADKIFTVFQRLHGRAEYAGTGVGLAICRKIVERHGGTISATAKVGEGATFEVLFP